MSLGTRLKTRFTGIVTVTMLLAIVGRFLPPFEFRSYEHERLWRIFDQQGRVMREFGGDKGTYLPLADMSSWIIRTTLFAEDNRFYQHGGLDLLAMARALAMNIRAGHTLGGGSTLTQQLARRMLGARPRNIWNKCLEAAVAEYLEWRLPKRRLLEYYFAQAPYANECYGIYAASWKYFNRPPRMISLAQASFLSVIPRNPNRYNPLRFKQRLIRQQKVLLKRMREDGVISAAEYAGALIEPIILQPPNEVLPAGHATDWIQRLFGQQRQDVHTTLDLDLNTAIEEQVRSYVSKLNTYGITNAAVLVLRNQDRAVLAMVGSADYWNPNISGEINGCLALRQPGSAIKPFTYGLALERGLPASYLLPDVETHFSTRYGDFTPRNYDEHYHGPMRLRMALGCSYNIPAVRVLKELGEDALLLRLRTAGFSGLKKPARHYGLGLTLGNGEVTLLELTRAYCALANAGKYQKEKVLQSEDPPPALPVFSEQVAFLLAQILSDQSARMPAFGEASPLYFPFPCAVKTGTTKNYHDNWCVGFTHDFTVGVWVGNFDGTPMHGVSGVSGAGPLFRDVMLMLHRHQRPEAFTMPSGITSRTVCPLSGDLAQTCCPDAMEEYFIAGYEPQSQCRFHRQGGEMVYPSIYREWVETRAENASISMADSADFYIDYPDQGDVFKIDPGLRLGYQKIRFKAVVPNTINRPLWLLDGSPCFHGLEAEWQLAPGEHTLCLRADQNGKAVATKKISFLVLP